MSDCNFNPFRLFTTWYEKAFDSEDSYPDAFSLATVNSQNQPSNRTVLLKLYDDESFTFFTNYDSQKGLELQENPKASMLFYWKTLKKQIRIQGEFYKSSKKTSDDYWITRPYESRLHAYLSKQSRELKLSTSQINSLMKETRAMHPTEIPRPENWGGFTLKPVYFEFWEEGDFRWHKRNTFTLSSNNTWETKKLYP